MFSENSRAKLIDCFTCFAIAIKALREYTYDLAIGANKRVKEVIGFKWFPLHYVQTLYE